jgi:hypothetical protein
MGKHRLADLFTAQQIVTFANNTSAFQYDAAHDQRLLKYVLAKGFKLSSICFSIHNRAPTNFIIQYTKIYAFITIGANKSTLTALSATFLHS